MELSAAVHDKRVNRENSAENKIIKPSSRLSTVCG